MTVGLVVVSHSRALAGAAVELASQMVAQDPPPIEVAAGAADGGLGTDAVAVAEAIARADDASGDGVLVLTDLGSAVLSAEMALELLEKPTSGEVLLSRGPLVEGLVGAAVRAAAGAALADVEAESVRAGGLKAELLGDAAPPSQTKDVPGAASVDVEIVNPQGLHARPAALFVARAAELPVEVTVSNLTSGTGPVDAASMLELMTLGGSAGDTLRLSASGPGADDALERLRALVADGLGE